MLRATTCINSGSGHLLTTSYEATATSCALVNHVALTYLQARWDTLSVKECSGPKNNILHMQLFSSWRYFTPGLEYVSVTSDGGAGQVCHAWQECWETVLLDLASSRSPQIYWFWWWKLWGQILAPMTCMTKIPLICMGPEFHPWNFASKVTLVYWRSLKSGICHLKQTMWNITWHTHICGCQCSRLKNVASIVCVQFVIFTSHEQHLLTHTYQSDYLSLIPTFCSFSESQNCPPIVKATF